MVSSKFCHHACADSIVDDDKMCHWHCLEQVARAEGNDLSFLATMPLVIEVPPVMQPRFERTLKALVAPALANGQNVAVVCLPSGRRVTQKTTWVNQWSRRIGKCFQFVTRCMCAFVPDTPEHRAIYVGTSATLPEHNCGQTPHGGSTVSMARMCTVAIIALAAMVLRSRGCYYS